MSKLLIIDAGHGSLDQNGHYTTIGKYYTHSKGKFHVGRTFYEGVFNRQVADKLIELCEKANVPYKRIYHAYEDWTLRQRTLLANKYCRENQNNAACISIHGNAFTNEKPRGTSVHVFTTPSIQSQRFGEEIGKNMLATIKETPLRRANRQTMYWQDNFAMVRDVICPAVLTENGFFTNYEDACLMMTDEFQYKIANTILNAFLTL